MAPDFKDVFQGCHDGADSAAVQGYACVGGVFVCYPMYAWSAALGTEHIGSCGKVNGLL